MELEYRALNRKRLINETKRRTMDVTLHNLNVVAWCIVRTSNTNAVAGFRKREEGRGKGEEGRGKKEERRGRRRRRRRRESRRRRKKKRRCEREKLTSIRDLARTAN